MGRLFRITNGWYGFEAPATELDVRAGGQTTVDGPVRNGMIFVWRRVAEGFPVTAADRPGGTVVPLPTQSAVRITAAEGHVLTLVAANGTSFRFDVDAMKLEHL